MINVIHATILKGSVCGLNQQNPCFSHGPLYVTCSHVVKPSALFVLPPNNKTKNVYQEVLDSGQ